MVHTSITHGPQMLSLHL